MTTTYDYTNSNNPAGGPSLSCGANGVFNSNCSVTFNTAGLGVAGNPDFQPDQIDGQPIFSSESIMFDFGFDRVLDSIGFGDWDGNDDLTLTWDGGSVLQHMDLAHCLRPFLPVWFPAALYRRF